MEKKRLSFYIFVSVAFIFLSLKSLACEQEGELNTVQTETTTESDWMAAMHDNISDSVYRSALWFDSFFMNDGCQQRKPQTSARIQLTWRPEVNDLSKMETRFRLKVKLPYLQDKADLILSDDEDDELNRLPLQQFSQVNQQRSESFSAAVRFVHKASDNQFTDSRIGLSGGDVFLRVRHQRVFTGWQRHSFKLEPAAYYFLQDGLGAKLLMEYNFQWQETKQLRFDYSVKVSEAYSGVKWRSGIYQLHQLSDMSASALGVMAEGEYHQQQGYRVDKYVASYRYRFNALRQWLFFEIEPFVEWRQEDNFSSTSGLALRVEGYFTKQ
jgi:hypothetical protein